MDFIQKTSESSNPEVIKKCCACGRWLVVRVAFFNKRDANCKDCEGANAYRALKVMNASAN